GAGDDYLVSVADWAVYVGGEGNDTIAIAENSWSWVFFGADAEANGRDNIAGFKAGENGDLMDFAEFLWGLPLFGWADVASDPAEFDLELPVSFFDDSDNEIVV